MVTGEIRIKLKGGIENISSSNCVGPLLANKQRSGLSRVRFQILPSEVNKDLYVGKMVRTSW